VQHFCDFLLHRPTAGLKAGALRRTWQPIVIMSLGAALGPEVMITSGGIAAAGVPGP
jgi:hypothetical protein